MPVNYMIKYYFSDKELDDVFRFFETILSLNSLAEKLKYCSRKNVNLKTTKAITQNLSKMTVLDF